MSNLFNAQRTRINYITSQEGLSTVLVRDILQSKDGFMWIATQDGLNRYDGTYFKIFRRDADNANSLPVSDVTCLLEMAPSMLLAGTRDGCAIVNPLTEKIIRLKLTQDKTAHVNGMDQLNDSIALIAVNEKLIAFNCRTQVASTIYSANHQKVLLVKVLHGTPFISLADGQALFYKNQQWQPLPGLSLKYIPLGYNSDKPGITAAVVAGEKIFFGTNSSGLLEYDNQFNPIKFRGLGAEFVQVRDMHFFNNEVQLATTGGFIRFDPELGITESLLPGSPPYALNTAVCNALTADNSGNVWIGTEAGGVNLITAKAQRFKLSPKSSEINHSQVFCFGESPSGEVLVGGSNLFIAFQPASGETIDYSHWANQTTILAIAHESDDWYWLGFWGSGIKRVNLKTGKSSELLNDNVGGNVLSLKKIGNKMYIGTLTDGLFVYDLTTKVIERYTEKEGLHAPSVSAIYVDMNGKWWLGSLENGVAKLSAPPSNGKIQVEQLYNSTNSKSPIAADEVRAIQHDRTGKIWVATSAGITVLNTNGSSRSFNQKDGLPNSSVYALLLDKNGRLWCPTNAGLFSFDPLHAGNDFTIREFNLKDGLVNNEHNMGAAFTLSNGELAIGGANGFNVFDPETVLHQYTPPHPIIVGYRRGGKDVVTDTAIIKKRFLQLNWRENYFQLELGALDFSNQSAVKFRYQLQGYDQDWSTPSNVRYVSYTELPGGTYTFMVQACNSDGIWSEATSSLVITVVPPFWKTIPFYLLMIFLLVVSVLTYTHLRNRAILKENKLLEQKVAERTKELEEKNHDIMSSIQYARRIQEAILPAKDQIFSRLQKVFILYKPKDIVSGDFYWFAEKNGWKIFAAVDCTGHGVPGAFMSMIGHNLLHKIVLDMGYYDPGEILTQLHKGVQKALRQGQNEVNTNDGMDVSMLAIHHESKEVRWAGANRPLVMVKHDSTFDRLEGNKFPVGGVQSDVNRVFTTQTVIAQEPTMVYMFSDGFADQFGGEKGKKFMVKRLHETLCSIHLLSAEEQRKELDKQFENWRGAHEQVDDVLVVGIEI